MDLPGDSEKNPAGFKFPPEAGGAGGEGESDEAREEREAEADGKRESWLQAEQ